MKANRTYKYKRTNMKYENAGAIDLALPYRYLYYGCKHVRFVSVISSKKI